MRTATEPVHLPAGFHESDAYRTLVTAIESEQAAKKFTARQALLESLQKNEADRATAEQKRARTLKPLEAAEAAAKSAHDTALTTLLDAKRAAALALHELQYTRDRLKRELVASADPRINEARRAMWAKYEKNRGGVPAKREVATGLLNFNTAKPQTRVETTDAALHRLVGAIRLADQSFDNLMLANPQDLDAAIEQALAPVEAAWAAIDSFDDQKAT